MTADERLAIIRVKVEWAKQHIRNLEVARNTFFNVRPYRIEPKLNPQTGQVFYYVWDIQPVPTDLALIAGDAVHNLRSALDHLAFQLVYANGGVHTKQTAYPFWDSSTEYEAQRHRRVKGMAQRAIDAIDVSYPYKGGNDLLWCIHYLDIADKHHALLLTIMNVRSVTFEIPSSIWLNRQSLGGFSMPTGVGTPLKDGDIILIREPDMQYEPHFAIDVSFTEPDIVRGHSILETLQHLSDLVDNLIGSFKPLLA